MCLQIVLGIVDIAFLFHLSLVSFYSTIFEVRGYDKYYINLQSIVYYQVSRKKIDFPQVGVIEIYIDLKERFFVKNYNLYVISYFSFK